MQWNGSSGRGFTSGKPWVAFAEDKANVAEQNGVDGSMLETYRGLIKVRRSSPALRRGAYREVPSGSESVFAFLREDPTERVLAAVNFSANDTTAELDLKSVGFGFHYPAVTADSAGRYLLELPAYQGRWILLK
jgi:glycosidase